MLRQKHRISGFGQRVRPTEALGCQGTASWPVPGLVPYLTPLSSFYYFLPSYASSSREAQGISDVYSYRVLQNLCAQKNPSTLMCILLSTVKVPEIIFIHSAASERGGARVGRGCMRNRDGGVTRSQSAVSQPRQERSAPSASERPAPTEGGPAEPRLSRRRVGAETRRRPASLADRAHLAVPAVGERARDDGPRPRLGEG